MIPGAIPLPTKQRDFSFGGRGEKMGYIFSVSLNLVFVPCHFDAWILQHAVFFCWACETYILQLKNLHAPICTLRISQKGGIQKLGEERSHEFCKLSPLSAFFILE